MVLNTLAAYVWGVLCFATKHAKPVMIASAADDDDEWTDAGDCDSMKGNARTRSRRQRANKANETKPTRSSRTAAVVPADDDGNDDDGKDDTDGGDEYEEEYEDVSHRNEHMLAGGIHETAVATPPAGKLSAKQRMEAAEQRLRDAMGTVAGGSGHVAGEVEHALHAGGEYLIADAGAGADAADEALYAAGKAKGLFSSGLD